MEEFAAALEFLFYIAVIVINLIILYVVFIQVPTESKAQEKINLALSKRIRKLEYPDEEETSPVFRDEPDWLR
jgi:hypothetical protein